MNYFIKIIVITLFLSNIFIFSEKAFSQTDYQLAIEYYNGGEYEKASTLFEKLYENSSAKFYFDYYLKCIIELKDYETAEKKVRKQIKKYSDEISYYVDLGYIYSLQDNDKETIKNYQYVIDNLGAENTKILTAANSFTSKKIYDWAEKVYIQAALNTGTTYHYEMASLYAVQMKKQEMITEYLEYLKEMPSQSETVKTLFEYYLNNDINDEFSELLRKSILLKLQEKPNDTLTELLIWFYIQKQDYYSAYIQSKSLDIKNKEIGVRVYTIAELAATNGDNSTAYEAYDYIVNKGSTFSYYNKSRFGILTVLYNQVINNEINTSEEFSNLEQKYLKTIEELGFNSLSIDIILDLAHLQAFYLNKPSDAITLLEKAISLTRLTSQQKGNCQIELGDILILTNDVWTATLTYAKAENDNIGNEVGDLAKFKKAKVYYYTGNFLWAQSQLDVLKASTSKLIANDAFELAKLIKETLEEDTLGISLQTYARADLLYSQNKVDEAILALDSLISAKTVYAIIDDAHFLKYKIYYSEYDNINAAENLQTIVDTYSYGNLADKALYLLAEMYLNDFDDSTKAMELYKKLITTFQGSMYVTDAREKYRKLRGDVL